MNDFKIGDKVVTKYDSRFQIAGSGQDMHRVSVGKEGIITEIFDPDTIMVDFDGISATVPTATLRRKYPEHPRRRFSLAKYVYYGRKKETSAIVMAQQIKLWACACDGEYAEWSGIGDVGQYQVRHPETGYCFRVEPEWCWGIQEDDDDN